MGSSILVRPEPALVAVVAIVSILLGEVVRALVAVALGDDTPRAAGRVWRVDRNLHLTGTVLVPALLAMVTGAAAGWAAPVPVGERALSRPRRAAVALASPAAHLTAGLLAAGLLSGATAVAIAVPNLLTGLLLLVPVPPFPGGALLAALVPALAARGSRWDQLRRTEVTPWGLAVLVLALGVDAAL